MLFSSIRAYLLFVLLISFRILFLYSLENKSPPNELTQISPPKKLPLLEEKSPTPELTQISLQKKLPLLEEKSPTPELTQISLQKNFHC